MKDLESRCTGCGACANICPHTAISMQYNNEGFLYPVIDENKCTKCGLCKKICPITNVTTTNNNKPDCYAYMVDNETRLKSSSGGVFSVIAQEFVNNGGYVCGAVWDENWYVHHIVSNKTEDIERMRGSKYVQSRIDNCYREIKKILDKNIKVLFTGTPCQIAGLKSFLKKEYETLYCMDIICHGTPSPKVNKKFLEENIDISLLDNIEYRSKDINGWGVLQKAVLKNNKNIILKDSEFMELFDKNVILRKSCGQCPYSTIPRQGDITTGDFWGVQTIDKKLNDNFGTSVVLINNKQGKKLLNILKNNAKLLKQAPLKKAVKFNPNLRKPSTIHPGREKFFAQLDNISVKENKNIVLDDKCDCMILNFWSAINYGALLTCYGVKLLTESLGLDSKVINYIDNNHRFDYQNSFCKQFAEKHLNLTKPVTQYQDFLNLNKYCNTFITGSDQIFNYEIMDSHTKEITPYIYLLDFVKSNARKIAYSGSFGFYKYNDTYENETLFRHYIKQFDAVSVREHYGKEIMKETFGIDAEQLIDSAFHIPKSTLEELTKNYIKDKKYLGYFGFEKPKEWQQNILNKIANELNLPLIIKTTADNLSLEEWLAFIKNSEFFVSMSYHAIVSAIIFNRPFVQIKDNPKQCRFESLYKMLEIKSNPITQFDSSINFNEIFATQDWEKVNININNEVKKAKEWMQEKLFATPGNHNDNNDVVNMLITKNILDNKRINLSISTIPTLKQQIFSVVKGEKYKIINVFGIKIKIKRKRYRKLKH